MAFAGIDVGTSGCKMVVYDLDGNVLTSGYRSYEELGQQGYREIDPDVVINQVLDVIKEVAEKTPESIEALAVASLGESIVCLDQSRKSLYNSMVTGDKRGIDECASLEQIISKQEIMDITGLPASEMYSLPKLMWMNENTDALKKAKYIFFYEDYVGYILTNKRKVSYSSASRSMAFDIEKKEWSKKLLSIVGISVEQLSTPSPTGTIVGTVTQEMSKKLGLSEDTIVVVGGHDQNCAALGAGVISTNQAEDGHGTCELMLMMLPKILKSPYMIEKDLACVPYVFPDTYLTYIEITTCGILLNWSKGTIFKGIYQNCESQGIDFFQYMDSKLENEPSELLILPQFGSSGNPNVSYDAKGLIWGLTIHTKPEEIYQAIKESMAYQLLMAYETLSSIGVDTESICITGGGSVSEFTLQVRADVFNKRIITMTSKESGTLGCAIVSATAIGKYASFEEGVRRAVKVKKTYYPDTKKHDLYMKKYEKFKELYNLMYKFN